LILYTYFIAISQLNRLQSIHLGFLGVSTVRCESPINAYWICLDFLGFSRPK
jgi:hypothetical protein